MSGLELPKAAGKPRQRPRTAAEWKRLGRGAVPMSKAAMAKRRVSFDAALVRMVAKEREDE